MEAYRAYFMCWPALPKIAHQDHVTVVTQSGSDTEKRQSEATGYFFSKQLLLSAERVSHPGQIPQLVRIPIVIGLKRMPSDVGD